MVVKLSETQKALRALLGIVLSTITLLITFFLFYNWFFDPELYYTKRNLLKYLKNNDLGEPYVKTSSTYKWKIEGLVLVYWFNEDSFSLHYPNVDCILPDLRFGFLSNSMSKKILNILKTKYYAN